jgi:glutamyl-tRNA reductase
MSIIVIGVNHTTASLAIREKIYFSLDTLPLYLQDILQRGYANEAVLLSTCNRSELYCDTKDVLLVQDWFYAQTMLPYTEIQPATYLYHGETAVLHIMEVACGLKSMILGEPQILGQMKQAYSESCAAGAVGALFHRLFQYVFMIAKDIRTTTSIGACPVSVASAAVHFAKQQLKTLAELQVVLIGAGETAELLMRYLNTHVTKPIILVNRSIDKAYKLIHTFGGHFYNLDCLPTVLAKADVIFSATGSAKPIVNKAMVIEAMQKRQQKPMLLIDIAVPRDIEPQVSSHPHVELYCIDDFKDMIAKNRQGREHAADKARDKIREKSLAFINEIASLDKVTHTIRAYRGQIEDLCQIELTKAKQHLHQGINPADVLEMFAKAYTNKLLHAPSVQLRQAGVEGRFELLRFAKQLFAIPDAETDETFCTNQIATTDSSL